MIRVLKWKIDAPSKKGKFKVCASTEIAVIGEEDGGATVGGGPPGGGVR